MTSFVQPATIVALRGGETFIQAMRAEYAARGDIIAASLNQIDGVVCPMQEDACYAFPQCPEAWGGSQAFAAYLMETAEVLLTPGSAYGPASRRHLRLSFATSISTIEDGLDRLSAGPP